MHASKPKSPAHALLYSGSDVICVDYFDVIQEFGKRLFQNGFFFESIYSLEMISNNSFSSTALLTLVQVVTSLSLICQMAVECAI
jgi:hypothetical protein